MSVLIKGLTMPESCSRCVCRQFDPYRYPANGVGTGAYECHVTKEECADGGRLENCPMEEVLIVKWQK